MTIQAASTTLGLNSNASTAVASSLVSRDASSLQPSTVDPSAESSLLNNVRLTVLQILRKQERQEQQERLDIERRIEQHVQAIVGNKTAISHKPPNAVSSKNAEDKAEDIEKQIACIMATLQDCPSNSRMKPLNERRVNDGRELITRSRALQYGMASHELTRQILGEK